jgi:hypothetical protein
MLAAIIPRCAGIDVGKKHLAVCVMSGPAEAEPEVELRKFRTLRVQLEALRKWLQAEGCTHVVMEHGRVLEASVERIGGRSGLLCASGAGQSTPSEGSHRA